ncbi:MAG: AAA family ATPase [Desulfobacteraceae bacterium]|nr:AAA family ATPase [Desulfobacteraceae bacterium]
MRMKIKRLKVKNFKSFETLDITLGDFNVIIGSNASGKSNFLDILRFIRNLEKHGLDNAISLQGGKDYFLNLAIGSDNPFSIEIEVEHNSKERPVIKIHDSRFTDIRFSGFYYSCEIKFHKRGNRYTLTRDEIQMYYEVFYFQENENTEESLGKGILKLSNKRGSVKPKLMANNIKNFDINDIYPAAFIKEPLPENLTLINTPYLMFPRGGGLFEKMALYNFAPESIKGASPIIGKVDLEENASNLPIVLKNIISQKEKRKKLVSLISDFLPFITDMRVAETTDKSLRLELKENFSNRQFIPSELLSDGTVHTTAVMVALYFGHQSISVFEEPERNMHPELVARLSTHMRDISCRKQIIVTTHDTEFLRNTEIDDVLFISRSPKGFSRISRISDREEVKHFLENEIGIDELYAGNLITV